MPTGLTTILSDTWQDVQRGRRLQETVHGLIRASQIVMFEENIALMSMSAEERIQMEATQRGTQFN